MAKYYIDARMLREHGACDGARAEFEQVFGDRADITLANIRKARDTVWLSEFVWPARQLYYATEYQSPHEAKANDLMYEGYDKLDRRDDKAVLRFLNRVGKAWAEFKAVKA